MNLHYSCSFSFCPYFQIIDDLIGSLSYTQTQRVLKLSLWFLHSASSDYLPTTMRRALCQWSWGDIKPCHQGPCPWMSAQLGRPTGRKVKACSGCHMIKTELHIKSKRKLVERIKWELHLHCLSYYRLLLRSICCYLLMESSIPTAKSNYGKPKEI